jgi:hypothetical protein
LLIREQTALGGVALRKTASPNICISPISLITAVEPVLEQCKGAKKKWKVRGYVKGAIARNEQTKDLFDTVVQLLYDDLDNDDEDLDDSDDNDEEN